MNSVITQMNSIWPMNNNFLFLFFIFFNFQFLVFSKINFIQTEHQRRKGLYKIISHKKLIDNRALGMAIFPR